MTGGINSRSRVLERDYPSHELGSATIRTEKFGLLQGEGPSTFRRVKENRKEYGDEITYTSTLMVPIESAIQNSQSDE